MLKLYVYNGLVYQWEEGTQPEGAKELPTKVVKPANKARTTRTKKQA